MKKLIFILSMLFALQVHGQFPIVIDGYVNDSSGAGIANKTVDISVLLGPTWTSFTQLTTDPTGNFNFSFNISDSAANFRFLVFDCLGDSILWTEYWDSSISDSLITSVTICSNSFPNCIASFTYQDFNPAFEFNGNSNLGGPATSYSWDFGDGNSSTGLNAVHSYQNPGTYLVCLTASDSITSCIFCDSIRVDYDSSLLRLGGNIGGSLSSTENNMMILYQLNNPFLQAIDTTLSLYGNYRFEGLSQGNYLVKCIPGNQSSNPGFIPQYWPSSPYWGDATSLFLSSDINNASFSFNSSGVNLNGNASITVSTRNAVGQNLENVTVWLEDMSGNILAYDISNSSGDIIFSNLPFDDYKIWADFPGYFMFPYILSPNSQEPDLRIDLSIQGNWLTTSVDKEIRTSKFHLYPNPAAEIFFIESDKKIVGVELFDLRGKELNLEWSKESNSYKIKLEDIPQSGLYQIRIKTKIGSITQKLMIK